MTVSGQHIRQDAHVIVDGRRVPGVVNLYDSEKVVVELAELPAVGMHLLQLQNPQGLFSNDFIFHVTLDAEVAAVLRRSIEQSHVESTQYRRAARSA
ncbi:MAG: hypothetical protein ACI9G1_000826 [Pirellulaceae bacterium]|jgi:hypothetical protein